MPRSKKPEECFPVKLTLARRKAVAGFAPALIDRLKLDEPSQRGIELTLTGLAEIKTKAQAAIRQASTGMQRRPPCHLLDSAALVLSQPRGIARKPATEQVYQLKITLLDSRPPIWRPVQLQDCTLDKLHEHIQTAMGCTNSHLHHFRIGEQFYGDPDLMEESFEDTEYKDSTARKVIDIQSGLFRRPGELPPGDRCRCPSPRSPVSQRTAHVPATGAGSPGRTSAA